MFTLYKVGQTYFTYNSKCNKNALKVSMKMLSALGHAYCFFRAKKRDTELASLGEQPTNLKKHRTGSVDNLLDTLSRHCTEEDTEDDQMFTAESTASESGMYIAMIVKRKNFLKIFLCCTTVRALLEKIMSSWKHLRTKVTPDFHLTYILTDFKNATSLFSCFCSGKIDQPATDY